MERGEAGAIDDDIIRLGAIAGWIVEIGIDVGGMGNVEKPSGEQARTHEVEEARRGLEEPE